MSLQNLEALRIKGLPTLIIYKSCKKITKQLQETQEIEPRATEQLA